MLPQVGTLELLILCGIALIVVGPKDLPMMLRKVGGFMGKMRRMATDFRSSFDDMARQSELDELRKEVENMRQLGDAQIGEVEQIFHDPTPNGAQTDPELDYDNLFHNEPAPEGPPEAFGDFNYDSQGAAAPKPKAARKKAAPKSAPAPAAAPKAKRAASVAAPKGKEAAPAAPPKAARKPAASVAAPATHRARRKPKSDSVT